MFNSFEFNINSFQIYTFSNFEDGSVSRKFNLGSARKNKILEKKFFFSNLLNLKLVFASFMHLQIKFILWINP